MKNNNANINHKEALSNKLYKADNFILVNPFLIEYFNDFVCEAKKLGIKKLVLITSLKDNSSDLLRKANSLYSFCTSCVVNKIAFEVRINNNLKEKNYLALRADKFVGKVVDLEILNNNELVYNPYWRIEPYDFEGVKFKDYLIKGSSSPLNHDEISKIVKTIDNYHKSNSEIQEDNINLNVTEHIKEKLDIL